MSASEDWAQQTVETVVTAWLARLSIAGALGLSIAVGPAGWPEAAAQQGLTRAQSDAVGSAAERRIRQALRPEAEAPRRDNEPTPGPASGTDGTPPARSLQPTGR